MVIKKGEDLPKSNVRYTFTGGFMNRKLIQVVGFMLAVVVILLPSKSLALIVSINWEQAQSMNSPRQGHSTVILSDGRLLAVGGVVQTWTPEAGQTFTWLKSCEIYDPATGSWTPTGSLNRERNGCGVILLPSQRVLVVGGSTPGGIDNSCEEWDPKTGKWTFVGQMQEYRAKTDPVLLSNGNVLVVGGGDQTSQRACELYNPQTKTWRLTGSLDLATGAGHTITLLLSGKVLVAGGSGREVLPTPTVSTNLCQLYDPVTEKWSYTASMIKKR